MNAKMKIEEHKIAVRDVFDGYVARSARCRD